MSSKLKTDLHHFSFTIYLEFQIIVECIIVRVYDWWDYGIALVSTFLYAISKFSLYSYTFSNVYDKHPCYCWNSTRLCYHVKPTDPFTKRSYMHPHFWLITLTNLASDFIYAKFVLGKANHNCGLRRFTEWLAILASHLINAQACSLNPTIALAYDR